MPADADFSYGYKQVRSLEAEALHSGLHRLAQGAARRGPRAREILLRPDQEGDKSHIAKHKLTKSIFLFRK